MSNKRIKLLKNKINDFNDRIDSILGKIRETTNEIDDMRFAGLSYHKYWSTDRIAKYIANSGNKSYVIRKDIVSVSYTLSYIIDDKLSYCKFNFDKDENVVIKQEIKQTLLDSDIKVDNNPQTYKSMKDLLHKLDLV
jgi:hypothetical protein